MSLICNSPGINAFGVLIMNAKLMGQCSLPLLVDEPKNKKDVLRNYLTGQLSELGLKWSDDNVSSAGETLVRSLTNCLWYIDGQHEVFSQRSVEIPECFGISVNFVQTGHQLQRESEQSVPPVRFFVHVCFVHPSTISLHVLCKIVSFDHSSSLCVVCIKKSVLHFQIVCRECSGE